ncbi:MULTISPECIES: hypothetical protein [Photobacterium]|uniref:DNA-binding protein n=1 Tax=Photobacterium toruni TaxID=1935446 RepID=A0A1T4PUC0_9GAMM|nr:MULTISPECIES: hypothetical protein [Photobacterium]PSV25674.1 hypothetical protein C0W28_00285 [Photobacterium kishitanii]PSW57931.1 hypothetical protein C0W54_21580 [Photobacterium kishitanii]CEO41951.1 conserved hypothetical protein. In SS9 not in TCK [Photobacterium kishitanii]SJZ95140.1 hypothetical protein CZ814_00880 [Photobacterium toruni]
MLNYQIAIPVPFVTVEQYCNLTGMAKGTVIDYIRKGKIIIKKKELPKEKPLINMVAMQRLAQQEAEINFP